MTSETQYTPGLWTWEEGQVQICAPYWDGQRIVVAEVIATGLKHHESPEKASEEAGANARRIVLAVNCHDELLAACKAARDATRLAVGRDGNSLDIALLDALESTIAIAKAKPAC